MAAMAILHIVLARHGQAEFVQRVSRALAAVGEDAHRMRRAFGEAHIDGAGIGLGGEAIGDDAPVGDAAHHRLNFGMIQAQHGKTVEGHILDKALEGVAHGFEGAVIIQMIGIGIGHHRDGGGQAQESAVAFIRLHHHPFARAQPRIGAIGIDDAAIDHGGVHAAAHPAAPPPGWWWWSCHWCRRWRRRNAAA